MQKNYDIEQLLLENEQMKERMWLNSNLTMFDDMLCNHYNKPLGIFADMVITHLAKLTQAIRGSFFGLSDDSEPIKAIAGYGCTPDSLVKQQFSIGEGLVGQAAKSKKVLILDDISSPECQVAGTLGQINGNCVVVIPLVFNQQVYGVLELLYLHNIEQRNYDLLERLSRNIAAMLQGIYDRIKNRKLLENSQNLEQELRQKMEELTVTQEEMRKKELELSSNIQAINQTIGTVEFDMKGKMLKTNQLFLDIMGCQAEEVIGRHYSVFLSSDQVQSKKHKSFWGKLQQGQTKSTEMKLLSKHNKEIWLKTSCCPIHDLNGFPVKIINFVQDITLEKKLKQDISNQLRAINRSTLLVEFDMEGYILKANHLFLDLLGYDAEEITGKPHQALIKNELDQSSRKYEKLWQKLRQGKFVEGEFQYVGKNGEIKWLKGNYNPILDLNGKPYKVLQYASDTTEHKRLETKNQHYLGELTENIEELMAAQEILKQKDQALSSRIQAIDCTIGSVEFTIEGKILKVNDLFLDLTGYTRDELEGKCHQIFVDSTYAQSEKYQEFWQDLRAGKSHQAELRRWGKGGKEIWMIATYTPIKNLDGVPHKVMKLAIDVTEQKKLRQDLSNQLTAINRSTAAAEFDLEGNILSANNLFLELMGYTWQELKGKHHRIFVESEFSQTTESQRFWPTLRSGQFIEGEFWLLDKAGNNIWTKGSYNPVLDLNNKPYKVIYHTLDVTYQKELEEKLKEQILKLNDYKFALDSSAIVALTDVKGQITYANDKFCELSGYSRGELLGQDHKILNSGYHPLEFIQNLWTTIAQGKVWRNEIQNCNKDGNLYWVDTTIVPFLNDKGKPYQYLSIRFDITHRKKLEKALQKRGEELEQERNQVKVINKELVVQNEIIADKNRSITDSIEYALRIQEAMLPQIDAIRTELPELFILYKPRDIVSGDFYWFMTVDAPHSDKQATNHKKVIIAAVDCTGHGVPGAFMSMIGNQLMINIVNSQRITAPDQILNRLNVGVREVLKQDQNKNQDGMDMSICVIDKVDRTLEFAGAKNSLVYIQDDTLQVAKADRASIGGFQSPDFQSFSKHIIQLSETSQEFYMSSDGYPDQIGGKRGRKFMHQNFQQKLFEHHQKPMKVQKDLLDEAFINWLTVVEQLDDVLVIGFRL